MVNYYVFDYTWLLVDRSISLPAGRLALGTKLCISSHFPRYPGANFTFIALASFIKVLLYFKFMKLTIKEVQRWEESRISCAFLFDKYKSINMPKIYIIAITIEGA